MDTAVACRRIGVLEQLAVGCDRPKAAQLREIIETVEDAIAHGVTHAALVQALASTGLTFTLGSFRTTLGRIRRMRREQQALMGQVAQPRAGSRTAASTPKTISGPAVVGQVAVGSESALPPDWLTSTQLTRDQLRRLSAAQRAARRKVLDQVIRETYFRSPYSGLKLAGAPDTSDAPNESETVT